MSKKGTVDRMIDDAVIQYNLDLLLVIQGVLEDPELSIMTEFFKDKIYNKVFDAFAEERLKIIDRFED